LCTRQVIMAISQGAAHTPDAYLTSFLALDTALLVRDLWTSSLQSLMKFQLE